MIVRISLALLLAAAEPAFAVTLYSGPAARRASPQTPAVRIVEAPVRSEAVEPLAGPASAVPRLAVPEIPAAAAPVAASPELPAPSALGQALSASEQLQAHASDEASSAALAKTFDGSADAAQASGAAAFDDALVAAAQSLYRFAKSPAVVVGVPIRPHGAPVDDAEVEARMHMSPLTNPEREQVVQELFIKAGAAPADIVTQPAGRGRNNIYLVKKGRTDRVVVVGAHHDKVAEGRGTIDNWTGSTMMINLYQALRDVDTEATYVFIGFAREEEGLIGSSVYVKSLSSAQRSKIDAMINLDTLAVDGTFSWQNNSTRALLDRIKQIAAAERRDLTEARLDGGDADSSSFRRAGVPAMTVFGASQDVIFDVIHSSRDNMAAFSLPHYRNAYLLTLALLKALDGAPLGRPGRV